MSLADIKYLIFKVRKMVNISLKIIAGAYKTMENSQKSCSLIFFEKNMQARKQCKRAIHTSFTAESDPMFYFFGLDRNCSGVFKSNS